MTKLSNFSFQDFMLGFPGFVKRILVVIADVFNCLIATWLAFYLRLDEFIWFFGDVEWSRGVLIASFLSVCIAIPVFILMKLYSEVLRFSSAHTFLSMIRAAALYGVLYSGLVTIFGLEGVPRTIGIIQPVIFLILSALLRFGVKMFFQVKRSTRPEAFGRARILIYGAGDAGCQFIRAMSGSTELEVIGFLDDDVTLHGRLLNGQRVYAPSDLKSLVSGSKVTDVLLAMPSIKRERRNEILGFLGRFPVAIRTMPSLADLVTGKFEILDILELEIDDLLGRDPVDPDRDLLSRNIKGRVILVTGAGGSIGSELCHQIVSQKPEKLLLLDQSEFSLYTVSEELMKSSKDGVIVIPLLCSVTDHQKITDIISRWKPHVIFHAAAYKHVPLVEKNIASGITNNVIGTRCIATAALDAGVENFVLVSTDKAVRPTNMMGATKRLAELVLQALAEHSLLTKFSMVRFGNVLGSSGSVVPLFRRQIKSGGPLTLTHPDVTRYFMTIQEASQLVIQASAISQGGEVFILDMGEAVLIKDLAIRMIELSGLTLKDTGNPNGDISIDIIGLRPGEKLYEELLIDGSHDPTEHTKIGKARELFLPWSDLEPALDILEEMAGNNDVEGMRSMMASLVVGYSPADTIVDWTHYD